MDIYINDIKIDYKLENEKSFSELITGIMNVLDKQEMYIISFNIDGKDYYFSQLDEIKNKKIEDIKRLKINALLKHELVSESSENIVKYISTVIDYFKNKSEYRDEDLEKIVEGLKWCLDATNKILELFGVIGELFIDNRGKNLKTIMTLLSDYINNIYSVQLDESFKEDFLEILISFSETIVKVVTYVFVMMKGIDKNQKINQFITLIDDNNKILEDYLTVIPKLRENLIEKINSKIESKKGNEKNDIYNYEAVGLNTITKIIEFSTYYLNIILKCSKDYLNEENDLFKEIISLIENYTKDLEILKKSLINREYEKICDYFENDIKDDLIKIEEFSIKLKDFLKSLDKK